MEEIVIIFKPDLVARGLEREAFCLLMNRLINAVPIYVKRTTLSKEKSRQHYNKDIGWMNKVGERIVKERRAEKLPITKTAKGYGKKILIELYKYISSGPVLIVVFEGPNGLIDRAREIIGNTDPKKAAPDSLRYIFGLDSIQNGFHCSENKSETEREKEIHFTKNELKHKLPL
jgi:nucleoside diphosphate kinase